MAVNDEFSADDIDDEKTIAYIKSYLPQELKTRFTDDELYYFLDLMDEYYVNSGVLDTPPDADGCIDIDLDKVVDYILKESKKDGMGPYGHDEVLFVVQGEMDYNESVE